MRRVKFRHPAHIVQWGYEEKVKLMCQSPTVILIIPSFMSLVTLQHKRVLVSTSPKINYCYNHRVH